MAYRLVWTERAKADYDAIKDAAIASLKARQRSKKAKPGKGEGLFKQVHGCLQKLAADPRHPGLQTHKFDSIEHPYENGKPVFEAYVQNKTPGAYRVFWCYGPDRADITIIAITPHP